MLLVADKCSARDDVLDCAKPYCVDCMLFMSIPLNYELETEPCTLL